MRVVVGEAGGSTRASIRSTLERAGFHIMGYAASDMGLEAVLAGVRPEAIVLDAQIGVRSVVAARQLAPAAKIVVVWPAGVSAGMADERVEPSRVSADLANVVRRIVGTPLDAPPMVYRPVVSQPRPALSSSWERSRRPRRHVAALTIAATLALGAAAFAIGAPHFERRGDATDRRTDGTHRHSLTSTTSTRHQDRSEGAGGRRGADGAGDSSTPPTACPSGTHGNGNGTPPTADGDHDNGRHLGNGTEGSCHPTGRPAGAGQEHPDNPQGGPGHGHGQGPGGGQGHSPAPTPTDHPHPGPDHSPAFRSET